jgi:hypothetical protein
MASSIRHLVIGVVIAVAIATIGVTVIGRAAALAPATQRAQAIASEPRGDQATLPTTAPRFSEHQELRRIFIDPTRERLR